MYQEDYLCLILKKNHIKKRGFIDESSLFYVKLRVYSENSKAFY